MPNKNYLRGVRYERKLKKEYEAAGWTALRTAGSHGVADLIVISQGGDVEFIQAKVVKTKAQAARLAKQFKPFLPTTNYVGDPVSYEQALHIWVTDTKETIMV